MYIDADRNASAVLMGHLLGYPIETSLMMPNLFAYDPETKVRMYLAVQYDLQSILEVNDARQTLTTQALLNTHWRDPLLAWDPMLYNNVTQVIQIQIQILYFHS